MILQLKEKAFSLIEIILSLGIFAILIGSLTVFSLDAYRAGYNSQKRIAASLVIQEVTNSLLNIKNSSWGTIIANADGQPHQISFFNGQYSLQEGQQTVNGFTISVLINSVSRDSNGNIVDSGGITDPGSRKINLTVAWKDNFNTDQSISSNLFINDWNTLAWRQTTEADFNAGTLDGVSVTNTDGGEVKLATVAYADWCNPTATLTSFDLPGQGIAQTISAITGKAYIGTGANASGLAFARVDVNYDGTTVTPTLNGTYDGNKVNMVFGDSSYGYLTTDTNSEEVVILNITQKPYTKVGYFDASSSQDGIAIYVSGNYGYMTQGNKLRIFDLSSKSGSRPEVGSVTLSGNGKKIFVSGNYVYVATNSTSNQLQIIDVSNPASPVVSSATTLGSTAGSSLFVSADTNRTYFVSSSNSSGPEVFIIDTTTKTGVRNILGAMDLNGMSPISVTSVEGANRLIAVGSGGEQYQVFNISNEANPIKCGGLTLSTTVYDVNTVYESNGDAFSYIITGESNAEMKLIKGGPGGGFGNGQGYAKVGTFTSQVFDSASSTTGYYTQTPVTSIPANSSLKMQLRGADTEAGVNVAAFTGPDGTASTYYSASSSEAINSNLTGKRYIQFKYYFTSNSVVTPILESLDITYQKSE